MKKFLLVALLLTAGMVATENVVANESTKQSALHKDPKPPTAVLQAFAGLVAYYQGFGDIRIVDVSWSFSKGNFTATYYFLYSDGQLYGPLSSTYNRQGQQI